MASERGPRALGGPMNEELLQADLERYRQKALELGASGAAVIPAAWVEVDERVRLKCIVPRCDHAGLTPNCPPNAPDLDLVRRALARYRWAVLIKCDVDIASHAPAAGTSTEEPLSFHRQGNQLVEDLERLAFRDGYHLTMGFGGGSCMADLCRGQPCQAMAGGACRFPYRSRPSMEAIGVDVMSLIHRAGWSAYAMQDDPNAAPFAITVGIVFVS